MFCKILLTVLISVCVPLNAYADEGNEGVAGRVAELEAQVAVLTALLADVSRFTDDFGYDTLRFSGMNVQITNGIAEPPPGEPPTTNGMGNLIIGYNRTRVDCPEGVECVDRRTGSGNLILGGKNNYTSFGSLISGGWSEVSAKHTVVLGGKFNLASGNRAAVIGGFNNIASGAGASVSGGAWNEASAFTASVSGGQGNLAEGDYSVAPFDAHTDNENAHHYPGGPAVE